MRRLVPVILLLMPSLASCGVLRSVPAEPAPEAPVSAAEASAVLHQVAQLAARRSADAAARICTTLADSCDALSGQFRADPATAPRTQPVLVCDIALPAIPGQRGARILVVAGRDAQGRSYAGQVLVERRHGRPVLHEPAFWIGVRYTQLAPGMAWGAAGDVPAGRADQEAAVRKACADPASFVAAVVLPTASP